MSDCSHEGPWPQSAARDEAPVEQPPAKVKDPIAEIYREHCDFVWQVLQHFRVDPQHAADALQDVFVVIQRRYDAFEHRASLRTWIYAITRRVASRYHRTGQRKHRKLEALAIDPTFVSSTPTPDDTLALVQGRELLSEFLERLDAKHREVFELQSLVGMTTREVAETTGLRPSTVIGRQRAAKLAFQRFCSRVQAQENQVLSGQRRLSPAVRSACWVAVLARLSLPASARASMGATAGATLKAWWLPAGAMRWVAITTVVAGGGSVVALESARSSPAVAPMHELAPAAGRAPGPTKAPKLAQYAVSDESVPELKPEPAPDPAPPQPEIQPAKAAPPQPSLPLTPAKARPRRAKHTDAAASPTKVPKPRPQVEKTTLPPLPSPSGLSRELALLRSIHRQNRGGNFHATLRMTDQYKQTYPQGKLTREAELARALALCALGQHSQGLAVAEPWLADQRDRSAQAARVLQICRPPKN